LSKMFDSLRRAEAERRRRGEHTGPVPEHPTIEPTPLPALELPVQPAQRAGISPRGVVSLEGDFLREMGILRNSLDAALGEQRRPVIVFASAVAGEGATTLATAYARLLALEGARRVLLVELNARRPALAARLGIQPGDGSTHYFTEVRPLSSVTQRLADAPGVDVVVAGTPDPVKIQLNLERRFPKLIEEARRSYDAVVLDAAPVTTSPETPPLAPLVDGVVLVVQAGRTKRQVVQRAMAMIEQFEGKLLGVVLNRKRYFIPEFIYRRL
jgi:Mrp family chromosome partitioning ATPase